MANKKKQPITAPVPDESSPEAIPPAPKKKVTGTNGRFVKGHAKVGGRKAGTPNAYGNIRDRLKEKLMPLVNNVDEWIAKIDDPKDKADALAKFMPYFLPKYNNITYSSDQLRPLSEEERLKELDDMYKKRDTAINIGKLTIVNNFADVDPNDDSGITRKDLGYED